MRLANSLWMPRATRRSRGRALRAAAALLIAAAMAEMPVNAAAKKSEVSWTPGNEAILGTYGGAALAEGGAVPLDLDGDGYSDVLLGTYYVGTPGYGGYYAFTLEALSHDGVDNRIYSDGASGKAQRGADGQAISRSGERARHYGTVECTLVRKFDNADDIPDATGATNGPGCQGGLGHFGGDGGYIGVLFHVPASAEVVAHHAYRAVGLDEQAFIFTSTDPNSMKISGVGVQPYSVTTAAKALTWGRLKTIYR